LISFDEELTGGASKRDAGRGRQNVNLCHAALAAVLRVAKTVTENDQSVFQWRCGPNPSAN